MEEEEQHGPDPEEEEDLDFKQVVEASLRTHAKEERRMSLDLDIVLRRSTEEA